MTRRIEVLRTGKVGVAFCTDWKEHHCRECKDSPDCNVIGKKLIGKDKKQEKEKVEFT